MLNKHKKIVIFGGAFNPPHFGHAVIIENLLSQFPCDEIWVMPSADRHDKTIGVSGKHRLKMLEILIKESFLNPKIPIKISTIELDRPRLTTTYDTKLELEKKHPNYEFYFVVGADSFNDIKTKWVNGEKLYKEAKFIVFSRPDVPLPEFLPENAVLLKKATAGTDISSTMMRSLIGEEKSIEKYTAKAVAGYIRENKLYK